MAAKLTIEQVKVTLAARNIEWLDGQYTNVRSKLLVKFPNGHIYETKYELLRDGYGCGCKTCISSIRSKANKGKIMSVETRKKIGDANRGEKNGAYGLKWKHSEEAKEKISRGKIGPKNPAYNHSKTTEERSLSKKRNLQTPGLNWWKRQIKKQAGYQCGICQSKKNLVAHHLDGYDKHPELRIDLDNGACLCKNCHESFHKQYGYGRNTKDQFLQFKREALSLSLNP